MLDSERYAEDWARRYFDLTLKRLMPFFQLGRTVARAITRLPEECSRAAPNSRLFLYPKNEAGGWIPKGPYWATAMRPCGRWGVSTPGALRRKKWRKHIPGRLTSAHIHAAREDSRRDIFERFDGKAQLLKRARAALAPTLGRARNILGAHGGPPKEGEPDLPFPRDLTPPSSLRVPGDVLFRLWRMLTRLARHDAALTDLVRAYGAAPPDRRIDLRFTRDSKNRFGRAIWTHPSLGTRCRLWSDFELRTLRVPYSVRRKLFAFERQRRKLTRARAKLIRALMRLTSSALSAVRNAEGILAGLRSPIAPAEAAMRGVNA